VWREGEMYIRSTGLGKTLLHARVKEIECTNLVPATLEPSKDGEEMERLLVTLQIIHPVTWTVRAFVEPKDVKEVAKFLLKPKNLFKALKFLFFGGASPSFDIEKEAEGHTG